METFFGKVTAESTAVLIVPCGMETVMLTVGHWQNIFVLIVPCGMETK